MAELESKLEFLLGLMGVEDQSLLQSSLGEFRRTVADCLELRRRRKEEQQYLRLVSDVQRMQEQKRQLVAENSELASAKRLLESASASSRELGRQDGPGQESPPRPDSLPSPEKAPDQPGRPDRDSPDSPPKTGSGGSAALHDSFLQTLTVHRTRLFEEDLPLSNIDNGSFEEDFKLDSSRLLPPATRKDFRAKVAADLRHLLRLLQDPDRSLPPELDSSFMHSLFAKVAQEVPALVRRILEKQGRDQDRLAELMPEIDREIVTRFRKVYESEQWIKTALQHIDEKVEEINQYETVLATREIQLVEREALAAELQLDSQQPQAISTDADRLSLRKRISRLEVRLERETAAKERAELEAGFLRSKLEALQRQLASLLKATPRPGLDVSGPPRVSPDLLEVPGTGQAGSQSLEAAETGQAQAVGSYLNKLRLLVQAEYKPHPEDADGAEDVSSLRRTPDLLESRGEPGESSSYPEEALQDVPVQPPEDPRPE